MKNKRILSLILALMMVLSLVPTALATDGTPARKTSSKPIVETQAPTEAPIETTAPAETQAPARETTAPEEVVGEVNATEPTVVEMDIESESNIVYAPSGVEFLNPAPLLAPVVGVAPSVPFSVFSFDAMGAVVGASEDDDLVLNKKVTPDDVEAENFTLTLEGYAIGSDGVMNKVPIPSDIVLVLDESGSMNDCIDCGHEINVECGEFIFDKTTGIPVNAKEKAVKAVSVSTDKTYKVIYKDGENSYSDRTLTYCKTCKAWFSSSNHSQHKPAGGGLYSWTPFEKTTDTPDYNRNDGDGYHVQFYCNCGASHTSNNKRSDALKAALDTFLENLYTNSLGEDGAVGGGDDIDNRVAVVGYGNEGENRIYTASSDSDLNGADLTDAAKKAFKKVVTQKNDIDTAIGYLEERYATATSEGMYTAKVILDNNPLKAGEERNRVVILFTDGSPGSGYVNSIPWANGAIEYSKDMKDDGATVYCVGLFWGADASDPDNLPTYDEDANGVDNLGFYKNGNRFLHLVSSNYPTATSLDNVGTVANLAEGEGYYLSTDNAQGLEDAFGKLASVIKPGSTNIELGSGAVMKDIVTKYFKIPDNVTDVTAWTETYTGKNAAGVDTWSKDNASVSNINTVVTADNGKLDVEVNGNTVTVTNFDFTENYVAIDKDENDNDVPRGKKLVLEINIEPVDGFLGGNSIITNEDTSGIYSSAEDEEPLERFPVPDVDVPLKVIEPIFQEQDIYVSQQAPLPEIVNIGNYTVDDVPYFVDGIRNGYVNIIYTIADPDGNTMTYTIDNGTHIDYLTDQGWDVPLDMSTYPLLEADTHYTVTCTVISKNLTTNQKEFDGGIDVNVYKPVITFQDSSIDLGDTPNYQTQNFVTVQWMHDGVLNTDATRPIQGTAPELTYTYSPAEGAFKQDTPVQVTVVTSAKNENNFVPIAQDIISHAGFIRQQCDVDWCDNTVQDITVDASEEGYVNFIVHLNTFNLRIIKEVSDENMKIDPNSSFLFRVTGPDNFSMDVVINGAGEVVIQGLRVGTYTVEELDWSWRYEPDETSKEVNGKTAVDGYKEVSFENNRDRTEWIDGEHYAENVFTGIYSPAAGN